MHGAHSNIFVVFGYEQLRTFLGPCDDCYDHQVAIPQTLYWFRHQGPLAMTFWECSPTFFILYRDEFIKNEKYPALLCNFAQAATSQTDCDKMWCVLVPFSLPVWTPKSGRLVARLVQSFFARGSLLLRFLG